MFNFKSNSLTILPLLASLFLVGNLPAQNPLRPKTNSFNWQDNQQSQQPATPSVMADTNTSRMVQAPERDPFTAEMQTESQPAVALMSYQTPAEPVSQPNPNTTSRSKQALIASADKLPWRDPNQILNLIMKISLNLVFVLSFAFGAILLARRWVQPSSGSRSTERLGGDSLSVLQTLRIDPKTSIRLVQWRSNRFLIACDQNGIQSVNALNDSFDQTLTELETEDQLVNKLLATLELKKQ